MINGGGPALSERIAQRGREVVVERLRSAFAHQSAARGDGVGLDPARLERMVQEAAARAGEALWRRSLAEAVMEELGIGLSEALAHPALGDAHELIEAGADAALDPAEAPSEPDETLAGGQALRMSVVHLNGIETLYQGEDDLELRLSEAGLDLLKRSSGIPIGRLEWSEIEVVALRAPRRGRRSRRRARELHVRTGQGQAQFELPGLTDEELREQLEPTLARLRSTPPRRGPGSNRAMVGSRAADALVR